jgi:hypothetical protein
MAQPVPPPNYYYPLNYYAPPPKKRSGCVTCLLIALIVGAIGCVASVVAAGVSGYFLLKNNTISEKQILGLVGKAPGEVNIINLGDENLNVVLTPLDTGDSGGMLFNNELALEPLDIDGFAMNPGRVRLEFSFPNSEPQGCTLRINSVVFHCPVTRPDSDQRSTHGESQTAGLAHLDRPYRAGSRKYPQPDQRPPEENRSGRS